jgi:hypothetical protein
MPVVDRATFMTTREGVFVGGDAAWGPENIIWAVEHGHQAAISIHNHCQGIAIAERPAYGMNLISTKMGIHEWRYSPSQIRVDSFSPSAASTSSKTARASGQASASARPMPITCAPCPGNTNALAMLPPCFALP